MKTTRKLKLTIIGDEETRKEQYKIIREEQYQQYKALNLCMTLLNTHNILNSYNTGAENKLNAQIDSIDKKIEQAKKELEKKGLKESKVSKLKETIEFLENDREKLKDEYLNSSKFRSDIDEKMKEMYIKDMYTVVQNQVNFRARDMMSLVTQRARKDFKNSLKNGMAKGEEVLLTIKEIFH